VRRPLAVQGNNRQRFQQAFADGLSVLGHERDGRGNGRFLLGEWDEAGGIRVLRRALRNAPRLENRQTWGTLYTGICKTEL